MRGAHRNDPPERCARAGGFLVVGPGARRGLDYEVGEVIGSVQSVRGFGLL